MKYDLLWPNDVPSDIKEKLNKEFNKKIQMFVGCPDITETWREIEFEVYKLETELAILLERKTLWKSKAQCKIKMTIDTK